MSDYSAKRAYCIIIHKRETRIETKKEFSHFNLQPALLDSINTVGFKHASPIQEMTIEPILSGKDIFAQAETGSGKTAAFVIPILEQILRDNAEGKVEAGKSMYAVLSPTRELAQQTDKVFRQFGKSLNISSCCVIGGESIDKQKELIRNGIHVLVATPGRLTDLIKQKIVFLDTCKGIVFDEADRLFDMGFKKDIEFILSKASKTRQLVMLSATNNQDVLRTAYKFNSDPDEIKLNEDSLLVDHIDHKLAMITQIEKFPFLVNLLRKQEDAYAIVFCNTQIQTHTVAEWLINMGFKAKPISGRLPQNQRTKLMADFRSKKVTILVCTDVAARGLDIKKVNLVVNYDIPLEAANYVHRIGRTGRAGESGQAISFAAHEDCENLDPIYEFIDAKIEKMDLEDSDFATDICRKPFLDRKTLKVSASSRERKSNNNRSKNTKPITDYKPKQRAEKTPEEIEQIALANKNRVDRRFIEKTAYDIESVKKEVMEFLRISDEALLGHRVLEEGGRKFILFGPKKTTYKFYIKPIYKKILLPFLIDLIKKSQMSLYVKVSYKPDSLLVSFSGKDEKMLTENKFELIDALEHLTRTYLQSRILISSKLRILVKCYKNNTNKRKESNDDQWLIKLADKMKKKLIDTNKPVKFKTLNPAERRIIHQYFQDDPKVKTSSVGDGRFKQIELSLL